MSDSCDPKDCSLPGSSVHGFLLQLLKGKESELQYISSLIFVYNPKDVSRGE